MKTLEFKSQICTTKEQSERLLALGLKKETADMVYHYQKSRIKAMQYELRSHPPTLKTTTHLNIEKLNVFGHKNADGKVMTGQEYFDELWGKDIPAWSLHRLMEIMYSGDVYGYTILKVHNRSIETIYECVITHIKTLIEIDQFNKDYLEEKQ